jgi:hypothetical protein
MMVAPRRIDCEVLKALMCSVHSLGVGTCPRRDRLDAPALAVSDDSERVDREGFPPPAAIENVPDVVEVLCQALLGNRVHQCRDVPVGRLLVRGPG